MKRSVNQMRRRLVALAAAAVLGLASPFLARARAASTTAPMAELMAPGPLPDMWIGKANAPVTVIEYASMTCPHCGDFHKKTYPTLKSKYIDTGKVRFVLREFPLDPLATAAFMLARCIGPDKRNAMIDFLFDQQENWAFVSKPLEALTKVVKQTGMSKKAVDACLQNKTLYNQVMQMRTIASTKFGVDATPTFFINGKKVEGEMSPQELEKELAPFLKG